MKNKKLLCLAGSLLLGAVSLVSCGETPATSQTSQGGGGTSQSASGKTLKVWAPTEDMVEGGFMEQAVALFKQQNPSYADVVFDLKPMSEGDAAKALKDDADAGADVFHFAGDQLSTLVKQNLLYQYTSTVVNGLDIPAGTLEAGKVNGKQYGIPFTPNTFFLYYDASVYTAEEVKSFNAIVSKSVSEYQYKFGLDVFNGWYLQSYFFSAGCNICGEAGDDTTAGITPLATAKKVARWTYDYLNGPNKSVLYSGDPGSKVGDSVAAGVTGTWNAAAIKAAIEKAGGTYAAAPLPKVDFNGDGTEETWLSVGDFKHIGVNRVSKELELSVRFAQFLAKPEAQKLRFQVRNTAPTSAEANTLPEIAQNPALVAQAEQSKTTFIQPTVYDSCKPSSFWDASTAFGSNIEAATSAIAVDDALDAFISAFTGA